VRRLTLERAILAVALLLAFAVAVSPAVDHDLWWHLRSGQWMVEHERILRADPFSHSRAGALRHPSDWLGQLALYGSWSLGGLTAVALLTAGLAAVGMALVLRACEGPALLRAAVVVLAAAAATSFWTARPQMFTFLLTAVVVLALTWFRRHSGTGAGRLWLLVPLFALWSNLHIGWFYGLGVLWVTLAGEGVDRALGRPALPAPAWRCLAGIAALSSVAVMANPVGPPVYRLILTQVDVGRKFIQENQPPRLDDPVTLPFFLLLATTAVVLALRWRRVSVADGLLIIGTAGAALTAARTISLFATVAAPVLAHHAAALLDARRSSVDPGGRTVRFPKVPVVNVGLVVAMAAVVSVSTVQRLAPTKVDEAIRRDFPVDAVRWIRATRPPGPVYNTFDWGGYLLWELPEYPVSIDGRADLHAEQLPVYDRTRRGQDWEAEFDRQGVRLAVLDTGGPLARAVAAHADWEVAYQDRLATVLLRRAA
jgi:hypothetical protein